MRTSLYVMLALLFIVSAAMSKATSVAIVPTGADAEQYAEQVRKQLSAYLQDNGMTVAEADAADYTLKVTLTTRASGHFEWLGLTYLPWTCYRPTMKMDITASAIKKNGAEVWSGNAKTKARAAYFKGFFQSKSELADKGLKHMAADLLASFVSKYK